MLQIGRQSWSQNFNSILQENPLPSTDANEWRVQLYHKSDGLKKDWWLGQNENPISRLSFELNIKLIGAGTIEFAFLDFPIDSDDYLLVYYNGNLVYRAIVDVSVDPKGGRVKLVPYAKRFEELIISPTYTTKTASEILENVITTISADTEITWNAAFVDTGSSDTFTKDYTGYETPKKIIDETVRALSGRNWGVNADNIFTVYEPSTTVDKTLFYGFSPAYAELKNTKDYTKIKATRYQVFKKVAGQGETTRIGEVGYGGSYPTLSVEDVVRKKEIKFNVSEKITDNNQALDEAYANLITQAIVPETTQIKELQVDKYFPVIGNRLRAQDRIEYVNRTILNCDVLTGDSTVINNPGFWNNVTIDTTTFVDNTASITFDNTDILKAFFYDFQETVNFFEPIKISFMVYCNRATNDLQFSVGTTDGFSIGNDSVGNDSISTSTFLASNNLDTVEITKGNVWLFKEYTITNPNIEEIGFKFLGADANSLTINIDRIQMYIPHREIYEQNVVKASFDINKDGAKCNATLNQYELLANEFQIETTRELEKIKTIQQDT